MKKEDIPQDHSAIKNYSSEVCYAIDESGKYTTVQSSGWEIKTTALNIAWEDIENRLQKAIEEVKSKKASPLLYFMEKKLMDIKLISSYTGFWKWQVKTHLKLNIFNKLSEKKLNKYAQLFDVNITELKNPNLNAD